MKIFSLLAIAVLVVIAGLVGVFSLVHGREKGIDRLVPEVKTPEVVQQLPKYLEPAGPPPEPAQAASSRVHKCIQGGKVVYTDMPCPRGQTERALDPERSRIVTLPPADPVATQPTPVAPATASPATPDIDVMADGTVRRVMR